ncbi:MAG: GNAT family N-acetyltransferase [Anaerolineales bacterium]|nr:GNAT family N-acetyltransferase [Anaerolineales bacterium]
MNLIYETRRDDFFISTNPDLLDAETACDFLAQTTWANNRPREKTKEALKNSLVFGVYYKERLIGLARVVTDCAIVAYLCDVFIHPDFRGAGLGKWLMESMLAHPQLKDVRRWLLTTEDAHGLYEKYGFELLDRAEQWMMRIRPFDGE